MVRVFKGVAVPRPVHCGYLLKRSTDGWEGNLNVISRGLRLSCRIFSVPAQQNDKGKNVQCPLAARCDPILWSCFFLFVSFLKYF